MEFLIHIYIYKKRFDTVFAQGDLGLNSGGVCIFPLCGLDVGDRLIIPREEK